MVSLGGITYTIWGMAAAQQGSHVNQNTLPDGMIVTTLSGKYITSVDGKFILTIDGFVPYTALKSLNGNPLVTLSGKYITK